MDPLRVLLIAHIVFGFTALAAAGASAVTKMLDLPHRGHKIAGTVFFVAMAGIFATAVPIALARNNLFLLLIALFSFYLAVAGWRYARNRAGTPRPIDWISAGTMCVVALAMAVWALTVFVRGGSGTAVVMLVFAGIGGALGGFDLRTLRSGGVRGSERIALHLTMMLSGTIATVTAFVVTNVRFGSAIVVWLAPTVVITPVIVIWNRKVRSS